MLASLSLSRCTACVALVSTVLSGQSLLAAAQSSSSSSATQAAAVSTTSTAKYGPASPPSALGAPAAFTAGPYFPSGVFEKFYSGYEPTQTAHEPQPMVSSPVDGTLYPLNLTEQDDTPEHNYIDPVVFPPAANLSNSTEGITVGATQSLSTNASLAIANGAFNEIAQIIGSNATYNTSCSKCVAGLLAVQHVAKTVPWEVPGLLIRLCSEYNYDAYGSCQSNFEQNSDGAVITQVLASANASALDGQWICHQFINSACPRPTTTPFDTSDWFASEKPSGAVAPNPSGKRIKVAHLSDFHLDPRYKVGAESNCSQYLCCQTFSNNTASPTTPLVPAPRYGAFLCDTPYDLAGAVIDAFPALTASNGSSPINFTIYTVTFCTFSAGVLLWRSQLSREFVEYEEDAIYTMLKKALGDGPVYAALGNHDSYPQAINSPAAIPASEIAGEFDWNYHHISSLWQTLGWIDADVAAVSRSHYGAYSTVTPQGLKIITLNADFWYADNYFNYINMTNPDLSGTLRFLTDELQEAESNGQRAYVIAHVLTGWSGTNGLPNPTDLFYQIIDRYSPHVVAAIFFGHTHEDQLSIFYANNATDISVDNALAVSWIAPSVTPLTNLNSGFRMYEVDAVTFDILDSYTWYANVSAFGTLDGQTEVGPTFHFEYSAREAYGANISWPSDAPLNATWWHLVTEQMESNPSLVDTFNTFQSKTSVMTPNCTSAVCQEAKVCYMRSGSTSLAYENCPSGYGSTQ